MTAFIVIGPDVPDLSIDLHIYRGDFHDLDRRHIVAVVDSDPEIVMAATAHGIDGVIWDQPHNQEFSWHFRARPDDVLAGLLRRFKEWKDRQA